MRVIVLAQGQGTRLASVLGKTPKHLVDVGGWSVLERTLWMVSGSPKVTVIGPVELARIKLHGAQLTTLQKPGLCILQGIEQTQSLWDRDDRTVFLLGDVVFSLDCLEKLMTDTTPYVMAGARVIEGTPGELYGLSVKGGKFADLFLRILRQRPCVDHGGVGQPGHLRLLLPELRRQDWAFAYHTISDYTDDIDEPGDLAELKAWRSGAAHLDVARGLDVLPMEVKMAWKTWKAMGARGIVVPDPTP